MLCALVLIRPEGFLVAGVLLIVYAINIRSRILRARPAVFNIAMISGFIVLSALYLSWRIQTFGYWAPNTYYAKIHPLGVNVVVAGLKFLLAFRKLSVVNLPKLLFILLMPCLFFSKKWDNDFSRNKYLIISVVALVSLLGAVYSGGDVYWDSSRLIALPLVLSVIGSLYAVSKLAGKLRYFLLAFLILITAGDFKRLGISSVCYSATKGIFDVPGILNEDKNYILRHAKLERLAIQKFVNKLPAKAKFCHTDYQRFKLFADDIEAIDLRGLNNKEIAHEIHSYCGPAGNLDINYGLHANPEIWAMGWHNPNRNSWMGLNTAKLLSDEERRKYFPEDIKQKISRRYKLASFLMYVDEYGPAYFNFWVRNDIADLLRNDDFVTISQK